MRISAQTFLKRKGRASIVMILQEATSSECFLFCPVLLISVNFNYIILREHLSNSILLPIESKYFRFISNSVTKYNFIVGFFLLNKCICTIFNIESKNNVMIYELPPFISK